MNERIKELAEQANPNFTKSYVVGPWYAEDIEKFAELIVRECAEVAHCNFHVDGLTLGNILKEHFGVEE
jgi:hypothetical protein